MNYEPIIYKSDSLYAKCLRIMKILHLGYTVPKRYREFLCSFLDDLDDDLKERLLKTGFVIQSDRCVLINLLLMSQKFNYNPNNIVSLPFAEFLQTDVASINCDISSLWNNNTLFVDPFDKESFEEAKILALKLKQYLKNTKYYIIDTEIHIFGDADNFKSEIPELDTSKFFFTTNESEFQRIDECSYQEISSIEIPQK